MENIWLFVGCALAVAAAAFTAWRWSRSWSAFSKHQLLAEWQYRKLRPESATRQRLLRASELFAAGWALLESAEDVDTARKALLLFGQAVELDEMGCGWKQRFEQKLTMIGDLFSLPGGKEQDRFHACLAEAYIVLLLNAVVDAYGKPSESMQQDYRVVRSRLDEAVHLQPKNPVAYKLRGDWCQRFPGHADRLAVRRDFETAMELAKADTEGKHFNLHGLLLDVQRDYILAYSHYQAASSLQQERAFELAQAHYEAVLRHADPDFVQLPDTHFNLAILAILTTESDSNSQQATLSRAARHFKKGLEAGQKLSRWCKAGDRVAQELAEALLTRLSASASFPPAADRAKKNA